MVCRTDCSPHGSLGRALYELQPSNKDARRKVRSQPINFSIFYEIDEQEAEHALSLNNYHKEDTGNTHNQDWVLLVM